MYLERVNRFFISFFILLFKSWLLDLDEECFSLLPDAELHITFWNNAAIQEDGLLAHFFDGSPTILDDAIDDFCLGWWLVRSLILVELLVLGNTMLIFIKENRDEHFKCCLVGKVHRSHASSDLPGLNVISPLELTARFCQDEVQLSRESGLLDEEQDSIVNVFSEELLRSCPLVSCFLLLG